MSILIKHHYLYHTIHTCVRGIFNPLLSQGRQCKFFTEKLVGASKVSGKTLLDALGKVDELGELPTYSEDTEKTYMEQMLSKGYTKLFTTMASDIESVLAIAREICDDLGMSSDDDFQEFLPSHGRAQKVVKFLLEQACTTTCLKILHSRAAAQKATGIINNVEKTLEFIDQNSVAVPAKVLARMHDLKQQLGGSNKRAKTA